MEIIEDKYNSMQEWGELAEAGNIKAIKFGLTEAINEGIDIYNDEHEEKREFLSDKQVGRMLTDLGLEEAATKLRKSVVEATKSDEKNS